MSADRRFRLTFIAGEESGELGRFLSGCGISRRTLTAVKYRGGNLYVNGLEKNVRHRLAAGDEVTVVFPPEQPAEGLLPEVGPLAIIYEDEALLILDKPAGQATIPSRDASSGTLANFVAGKFRSEGLPATVHVVTRLDRETSGLVCIAKNRHIHHLMSEKLKAGGMFKRYAAIVPGRFESGHFTIDDPIGRKKGSIIEREVRPDGQPALTEVRVVRTGMPAGRPLNELSVILHTGRTHQIRVHLASIGHPLEGDSLYGGDLSILGRQALHCRELAFDHPLTGKPVRFLSELPEDMRISGLSRGND
ncbi:RluA family pseudouridine synthase [Edaphobacillus lindanitolerans]|uniref:Pseudouridine synthase n=1 Tax=Edaphobacillus lindanitolerans TaxID=550447 RepID=A0A1U7PLH1_9BACI|nr:RluA family pseudouridine synthase [Edaphobacillus lindanitolerans]SIT68732.1 23S rRNA pseudouridine1911/1915/1917 synthase [Edaphobacillus lindanitolerans]